MKARPDQPRQASRKGKPDSKEDRLADALRANLRRRKAPRKPSRMTVMPRKNRRTSRNRAGIGAKTARGSINHARVPRE